MAITRSSLLDRNTVKAAPRNDELLQGLKAVHDEIKAATLEEIARIKSLVASEVNGVKSHLDSKFKDLETEALLRVGKGLDEYVADTLENSTLKHIAVLEKQYADRQEVLQKSHDEFAARVASLEEVLMKRLEEMEETYNKKAAFIQQTQDESMGRLMALIERIQLPAPVITVEGATVNLPPSENIINLPQQLPAEVIFNAPENKAAEVVVNTSPPRLTKKLFKYLEDGRPSEIIEQEM